MEALPLALGVGLALLAVRAAQSRGRATPIDTLSPLWAESIEKAQATLPLLKDLQQDSTLEPWVKFGFTTSNGEKEHVWGRLLEFSGQSMRVSMETPPINHKGLVPESISLTWNELEDWQIELPDGRFRGGFTTQAQIKLARAAGQRIPRHVLEQESRFVDTV